jgi:hypothetical protein
MLQGVYEGCTVVHTLKTPLVPQGNHHVLALA